MASALSGRRRLPISLLFLSLFVAACSDDGLPGAKDIGPPAADAADSRAPGADAGDLIAPDDGGLGDLMPTGGSIAIYVAGDMEQIAFSDGLSGQTPSDYQIAVSRYYTLRSADDVSPALCFDHGSQHAIAEISGDTLVGACETSAIPTATYTHGRTKVEWSRYSVDGVYHLVGQAIPTKMTVFRAYSDTTYQGKQYMAGQGMFSFSGGPVPVEIPVTFPPLPNVPGVGFETVDGEFFMTFVYSKPLFIEQNSADEHWARFHWKVKDAFRWSDKDLPGYSAGSWDLAADVVNSELVMMYGVSGYTITASTD